MITNDGVTITRDLLLSGNTAFISHMAIGSGNAIPDVTQTGLGSEFNRKAVTLIALGSPQVGTTFRVDWNSVQVSGAQPITEVGLFSDVSTGSIYNRARFDPVEVSAGSEWRFELNVEEI